MVNIKLWFLMGFCLVLLLGCQEKLSYSYLITHPVALKKNISACQTRREATPVQVAECQVVVKATADLMALVHTFQADPEQFGQSILEAESKCANLHDKWREAQLLLNALHKRQASTIELAEAKKNLEQAKEAYLKQRLRVRTLLAVVGMNSPE